MVGKGLTALFVNQVGSVIRHVSITAVVLLLITRLTLVLCMYNHLFYRC